MKIFLYALVKYKIKNVIKMYHDTQEDAEKHIIKSDKTRATYYTIISHQQWGRKENYDLCLDCSIGNQKVANAICKYISKQIKK